MSETNEKELLEEIRNVSIPVEGAQDYDSLLKLIGDSSFVLLGAATHGTLEFHSARADITMRLIREKNFAAVAVEADWPDAYRINRYVRGMGLDRFASDSLDDFTQFPAWMWKNEATLDFIGELHEHNSLLPDKSKVGFYGLDLYSFYSSADATIRFLAETDPEAAERARSRFSCFEQFNHGSESNGIEAAMDIEESLRDKAAARLSELRREGMERIRKEGLTARGELFFARQNALLAETAEEHYRMMFSGRTSMWNSRDRHMADTLDALAGHIALVRPPKVVAWAHNSHIGDARATDFSDWGRVNLGQLARERHGTDAALVGFTTYHGTVSAASDWGAAVERKKIQPASPGSCEDLFHRTGTRSFLLPLRNPPQSMQALHDRRPERAIGAVYQPRSERSNHNIYADLQNQFDAIIHFDHTKAVKPLEYNPVWEAGEVTENVSVVR